MSGNHDRGPWIWTHSGLKVHLLNPLTEEVSLADIAFSLARMCRFNCHCEWYSVAEHCVLASQLAPPGLELVALLHDAHEYVIGDLTRPLTASLPVGSSTDISVLKSILDDAIMLRFGLPAVNGTVARQLREIDDRLLATECLALLGKEALREWGLTADPYKHLRLHCWERDQAAREFLNRFESLTIHAGGNQ